MTDVLHPPSVPLSEAPALDPVGRPGVVATVTFADGRTATEAVGLANLESPTPVTRDTVFNVGSVAKQVTAYLVVLAHRARTLPLDTSVADVLPSFQLPDVTVVDLVRHRSGVRDAETLLSLAGLRDLDHYTTGDLLALAYRQTSRAVAPNRFLYSNTNYLLLAELLARAGMMSFTSLATELVFDPVGMTSARFKSDVADVVPHAAASYLPTAGDGWAKAERPVALPGPGSLWCSGSDIDLWLAHLHRQWPPGLLSGPLAAEVGYVPSDRLGSQYGPGLYLVPGPRRIAYHDGHEHGFSAAVRLTPEGTRVVCMSNDASLRADRIADQAMTTLNRGTDLAPGWLHHLVAEHRCRPPVSSPEPAIRVTSPDGHSWLGTYRCAEAPGAIRLSTRDETLYLWRRGAADRLTGSADGRTYAGPGYRVDLPAARAGLEHLTLNLQRAPGLLYVRDSPR